MFRARLRVLELLEPGLRAIVHSFGVEIKIHHLVVGHQARFPSRTADIHFLDEQFVVPDVEAGAKRRLARPVVLQVPAVDGLVRRRRDEVGTVGRGCERSHVGLMAGTQAHALRGGWRQCVNAYTHQVSDCQPQRLRIGGRQKRVAARHAVAKVIERQFEFSAFWCDRIPEKRVGQTRFDGPTFPGVKLLGGLEAVGVQPFSLLLIENAPRSLAAVVGIKHSAGLR